MVVDWFYTLHAVKMWWKNEEGLAAIEAAMLFPVMMTLMLGSYDLGTGIVLNGRTITATQVAADLISRDKTVNQADVNDIIMAAQLAYEPFGLRDFGIDIVSVEFDSQRRPQVLWRETRDMSANNNALENIQGMGDQGDGMIIVTVEYTYKPLFAKYFTGEMKMVETAYSRGRRSPTVEWEG
ncbi:MAG: hypothetical protein DI586_05345 [Micavibrio aeruginosavorus]|uniref:TadE-like domain-containing protein n=1 Tax=Micavibrio aeruginosavorus TaxID=349221 RepID=A0A2W5FQ37_9BACT|nr:MAG: hypothetical protein DI586_05345 [Micavibrio aeruginosavorus]